MKRILLLSVLMVLFASSLPALSLLGLSGGWGMVSFAHEEEGKEVRTGERGVSLSIDYDYFVSGNLALHCGVDAALSAVTYIGGEKLSSFPGYVLKAGLDYRNGIVKIGTGIHYRTLNGEEGGKRRSVKSLLLYLDSSIVLLPSPSLVIGVVYGCPLSAYLVKEGESARKLELRNRIPDRGSLSVYGGVEYSL